MIIGPEDRNHQHVRHVVSHASYHQTMALTAITGSYGLCSDEKRKAVTRLIVTYLKCWNFKNFSMPDPVTAVAVRLRISKSGTERTSRSSWKRKLQQMKDNAITS
jgi:hypothetical protein